MRAGELNRRITIQSKTITYDTFNQPIETWGTFKTVWAGVITTGGREFYAAQKLNAETAAVFKIRYNGSITPAMRILYGTRTFGIIGINNVNGMNVELLVSCKEVV